MNISVKEELKKANNMVNMLIVEGHNNDWTEQREALTLIQHTIVSALNELARRGWINES